MSDTTLRARRDERIAAGVFDRLEAEAHAAFDTILGLDLSHVAVDGSRHKAPYGGEETGPNPTDRGKVGWKWSVAADRHGMPIGRRTAAANGNDCSLLFTTLAAVAVRRLLAAIETRHLDRSDDFAIQRRGTKAIGGMNGGKRRKRRHRQTRRCRRFRRYCWESRGADRGTRTRDLLFTKQLLCQLS